MLLRLQLGVCIQVTRRIQQGGIEDVWRGHVLTGNEVLAQDSLHRPQDLRVTGLQAAVTSSVNEGVEGDLHNLLDGMEADSMQADRMEADGMEGGAASVAWRMALHAAVVCA